MNTSDQAVLRALYEEKTPIPRGVIYRKAGIARTTAYDALQRQIIAQNVSVSSEPREEVGRPRRLYELNEYWLEKDSKELPF